MQTKQWLGLQQLRTELLTDGSLLHRFGGLTATYPSSTEQPAGLVANADPFVTAASLTEQPTAQAPTSRRNSRQKINRDLRPLPAPWIKRRENTRKTLQRVRVQRRMRERLAAGPRKP
ncbi:MAG: hypothetical protein ACTHM1_10375 [Solirubrobacteraceae bacterium]